jgi:hypothetical protein
LLVVVAAVVGHREAIADVAAIIRDPVIFGILYVCYMTICVKIVSPVGFASLDAFPPIVQELLFHGFPFNYENSTIKHPLTYYICPTKIPLGMAWSAQ